MEDAIISEKKLQDPGGNLPLGKEQMLSANFHSLDNIVE